MTFLELCQKTRRESGVAYSSVYLTTVTGNAGIYDKIVEWVRDSWTDIQREYPSWKFLRAKAQKTLTVGQSAYALNVGAPPAGTDFQLANVRAFDSALCFTFEPDGSARGPLVERSYEDFVAKYPTISTGRPSEFCVDLDGVVRFNSTPDKAYKIDLHYWKTATVLTGDGDVPACPEDFHETIVWWALVRYAVSEGAMQEKPEWRSNYARCLRRLEVDQLSIPSRFQVAPLA